MRTRTVLRGVAATALTLSALGLGMGTASADGWKDGYLDNTEFGLFCKANYQNSVFDLSATDEDFGDDFFKGSRSCAGQMVNENTQSYINNSCGFYVWTNAGMWGDKGFIPEGHRGNASATFKQRISSAARNC
ncbi:MULTISPECIES: hypothetical protein [unclassified Streptomyces]|uniref:hypothetical protein n=1 Tax=unclassified Streptomyces TaxID=2593676 RepID=UPI002E16217F|nr:hypothetical protein OG457_20015 [Streptomyces sp. NBC_01207]WTA19264.1 hypothetical protein OG365_14915 [Streptomyces sp. NBC_00853]